MWFPVWIARRRETGSVSFRIEHSHFPTYRDDDLPIGPGEHLVVLERGTFVTVSGWTGSPDQLVTDVHARMSYGANMRAGDWLRPGGRKPSTHKIPAGRHALYLISDREDGRYFSPIVEFTLVKGDQRDFHLPLQPPRRLRAGSTRTSRGRCGTARWCSICSTRPPASR